MKSTLPTDAVVGKHIRQPRLRCLDGGVSPFSLLRARGEAERGDGVVASHIGDGIVTGPGTDSRQIKGMYFNVNLKLKSRPSGRL